MRESRSGIGGGKVLTVGHPNSFEAMAKVGAAPVGTREARAVVGKAPMLFDVAAAAILHKN